jgi:hypothetical protein
VGPTGTILPTQTKQCPATWDCRVLGMQRRLIKIAHKKRNQTTKNVVCWDPIFLHLSSRNVVNEIINASLKDYIKAPLSGGQMRCM